jgi:guanosine-3',5'-bis(diphosphate) 3'-pyrophosphohydrolase
MEQEKALPLILKALRFAAHKHRDQRRKNRGATPYINHPIEVAEILCRIGGVSDPEILCGAILHDTIEDTETTPEELEKEFGAAVLGIVQAVTDDKRLPKEVRKNLQISHAPDLPDEAKLVKLADKICNIRDVISEPPAGWSLARRREYLLWAERVVNGLRGVSAPLEQEFDALAARGREL